MRKMRPQCQQRLDASFTHTLLHKAPIGLEVRSLISSPGNFQTPLPANVVVTNKNTKKLLEFSHPCLSLAMRIHQKPAQQILIKESHPDVRWPSVPESFNPNIDNIEENFFTPNYMTLINGARDDDTFKHRHVYQPSQKGLQPRHCKQKTIQESHLNLSYATTMTNKYESN